LETLAIIAYRQPVARAEIEGVRGVAVDHILRLLMEMQLVKIIGRSNLPGRPLLYGTTALFLEHFGLKDVTELPGIEELARRSEQRVQIPRGSEAEVSAAVAGDGGDAAMAEPGTEETADPGKQEGIDEPG
jgi:segregation and condensation protein B